MFEIRSRLRSYLLPLSLALLAFAASPAEAADGVEVGPTFVIKGEITPNDEDCFLAELSAGGSLSLSVKAGKGTELLPAVFLKRPDGTVVSVTGQLKGLTKAKVTLRKFAIEETGKWSICVTGAGTTGTYTLALKFRAAKKAKDPAIIVPAGGTVDCAFAARNGDLLTVKIKEVSGPATGGVAVIDPAGQAVEGATLTRKGPKIGGKKIPLNSGFGNYVVRFTGSETGATTVSCKVSLKLAKIQKETLELGPEPFPDSAVPFSGPAGQPVTITGTNFVDGAVVLFGDTPSESVSVGSSTSIIATAPDGTNADEGNRVDLTVRNPDGQSNVLEDGFAYFGPPAGSTVTPAYSPLAGDVELTVTGSHFHPGATVTIGGLPAEDVIVVGFNTIICTSPSSDTAGPAPVVVTDAFGRATDPINGHSWVAGPTVSSATPDEVASFGGMSVTLTGSGFRFGGTDVLLDGEVVSDPSVSGSTSLSFIMPAGDKGTVTVEVRDEFSQGETKVALIERTRSLSEITATALPAAPDGTDFFGSRLSAGDLDGDEDIDLAVTSARNYTVSGTWLLFNDGAGGFTDGTATNLGAFSYTDDRAQGEAAALGDLDGDGADELLVAHTYPQQSPDSFYKAGVYYSVYYYVIYNGYYYQDYNTFLALRTGSNDGNGAITETTYTTLPFPASGPYFGYGERWQAEDIAVGDLDGDNDLDILVTTSLPVAYASNDLVYYYSYYHPKSMNTYTYLYYAQTAYYSPATRVLQNDGSSSFTWLPYAFPEVYTYGGDAVSYGGLIEDWGGRAIALGDLDGDDSGSLDVVIVSPYLSYNYYGYVFDGYYLPATGVFLNDGTGYFKLDAYAVPDAYALDYAGSYDYWQGDAVAAGDLDDDGDLDIVIGRRSVTYWYDGDSGEYLLIPAVRVFENDGSGGFTEATSDFLPDELLFGGDEALMGVHSIAVGDLDGDGYADLVLAGTVYDADSVHGGDAYADLLPTSKVPATRVLLADDEGGFDDVTTSWLPAPTGGDWFQSHDVVLADIDGDGDLDLVLVFDGVPDDSGGLSGNRPVRIFENR